MPRSHPSRSATGRASRTSTATPSTRRRYGRITACLKQWKLSRDSCAVVAGDATVADRVVGVGARAVSPLPRARRAVKAGRWAARRGSLDGPVIHLVREWIVKPSGLAVASSKTRCAAVSISPRGCGGQADRARLLGHVFAGPRDRGRAWSGAAQPAVLNHIRRPRGSCRYPSRSAGCVRAGSPVDGLREATDLAVT